MVHLSMGFSLPKVEILVWLVIPILILSVTNWIEKVLVELATCFQTP